MPRARGATWLRSAPRSALLVTLVTLYLAAICCVSAQPRGYRSVNSAGSETQSRARESHAMAHDEDDDEDDDDWDFMSDAAILSLAAQQLATTVPAVSTCVKALSPAFLNDDYCDCDDGSDEPLTSACSHILQPDLLPFQCRSGGQKFASAFVGDGVCDCCDGSDEALTLPASNCPNTCADRHSQILQDLQQRLEAVHSGLQVRDSYNSLHDAKLDSLRSTLDESTMIASAVQRAFNFKQQKLQDSGVQPSPQERQQLEAMYYQLQNWQYQLFVQRKVLEPSTFEDREWKAPFAALVGQCFDYVVNEKQLKGGTVNVIPREYVFSFCPFQNITQSEPEYPQWTLAERNAKKGEDQKDRAALDLPAAPQPILLGLWDQWAPSSAPVTAANKAEGAASHRLQKYDFGHKCANDQHRIVHVDISCGATNRVMSIDENEMCIYSLVFTSPAACDERDRLVVEREIDRVQRVFESSSEEESTNPQSRATGHEEL